MAVHPGETYTLTFSDTSLLGAGIARLGGIALFCPGTTAGDTAEVRITEVKKRYIHAQLLRIITPSPDRRTPDCGISAECGGCLFRHISYESEAKWKEEAVRGALRRFDGITWEPIFTAFPDEYRNKTVFHLDAQYRAGYYAAATNAFCYPPEGRCRLHAPLFDRIAAASAEILAGYKKALPFRALAIRRNTEMEFTAVLHASETTDDVRSAAAHWAEELSKIFPEAVGLFLGHGMPEEPDVRYTLIRGEKYLTDSFLSLRLRISPAAFYQINHDVAEALCTTVAEYAALKPGESAADLYCGTGTIGLTLASLSPQASVTGIEINESAVRDAVANAERNGIANIRFRCGDSATAEADGLHFDCVVIDPPRKGCSPEMLAALKRLSPERIVYVSCNPATLARDAAALADAGWQITRARAFDMFPRTGHCETVVCLSREKADDYVRISVHTKDLKTSIT